MYKTKLSSFISEYGDGIHGTPIYSDDGEYFFINGNNLEKGIIVIDEDTLKIDYEQFRKISRPLNDRTVLLSINGTLGNTAFYRGENVALGKSACYINIKSEYSKEFFRYILTTKEFQKYMLRVAHGSTIKNFAPSQVGEYEVELPDIEEHENIAKLLSSIDDKIFNNNLICDDLEGMAKLLYDYWFVQFDFPDENGKPDKSSGGKMVWNEELKREIPDGWETGSVGNHVSVRRGVSYNSNDIIGNGIPMLNLNSFNTDATYKESGIKTYSGDFSNDKIVSPYDLIICATQQTDIDLSGKTNVIGKALLVPDIFESPIITSMDVITLICDDSFNKYYLRATINTPFYHKFIVGFANGTKIKHLDISGLLNMQHEIPPNGIMSKYSSVIELFEKEKSKIIRENQELASLRDFLLPMLMNGQVTVKKGETQ